ncbi:retrovirus-related pol polyprotein from transposon TNT 1-94 [Tanacetum coccineum]
MVAEDDEMSKEEEIDKLMALISLSFKKIYKPTNNNLRTSSNTSRAHQGNTLRINRGTGYDNQRAVNVARARENVGTQIQEVIPYAADNSGSIFDTKSLQKDDNDLAKECALLASLIEKLKCEINDIKNNNKFLESSKKALVDKLKDLKKFQVEIDRYHDVNYALKVAIDCAKAKGDLMSYKMESEKLFNEYTWKINDLNKTVSEIKKELFAHQETISIMSQGKEAQIKFYKTRKEKEIEKVKALDDIVYKTGQLVQTMNMLNRNCKTSFVKPKFLKKAQRANPRQYDIGCYNDNLALMLAHESDKTIRVIPTTSVSRLQLKSNRLEDRGMHNNSQGKKQQVEDHRKANRKSFKTKTSPSSKRRLQILHMDLCGPIRVESFNVRTVRTDRGTEFLNKTLHAYFAQEGIEHEMSTAQTPKQNDVVERRNRTLVEAARTMLSAAKVPFLMFNELLNGTTLVVSKSFIVTATDAPNQRQQQHTTPSTLTNVAANTPPLNIQTTPETASQAPTQAPTVTTNENINQTKTNKENAQVEDDEYINIFSTLVQELWETSSLHVDSSNMHTIYQRHPSKHRWTKDNLIEQIIRNPSQSIRTRPKGYSQQEGIDFEESFAPVARLEAVWYAQEILKKHGMTSCDSVGTPMATKPLDADLSGTYVDQMKYHSMVRALMYLKSSRLDILHATCYCAHF